MPPWPAVLGFMAAYTALKDIKVTCTMQVFLEV